MFEGREERNQYLQSTLLFLSSCESITRGGNESRIVKRVLLGATGNIVGLVPGSEPLTLSNLSFF